MTRGQMGKRLQGPTGSLNLLETGPSQDFFNCWEVDLEAYSNFWIVVSRRRPLSSVHDHIGSENLVTLRKALLITFF